MASTSFSPSQIPAWNKLHELFPQGIPAEFSGSQIAHPRTGQTSIKYNGKLSARISCSVQCRKHANCWCGIHRLSILKFAMGPGPYIALDDGRTPSREVKGCTWRRQTQQWRGQQQGQGGEQRRWLAVTISVLFHRQLNMLSTDLSLWHVRIEVKV